jgi:hypothetical protein
VKKIREEFHDSLVENRKQLATHRASIMNMKFERSQKRSSIVDESKDFQTDPYPPQGNWISSWCGKLDVIGTGAALVAIDPLPHPHDGTKWLIICLMASLSSTQHVFSGGQREFSVLKGFFRPENGFLWSNGRRPIMQIMCLSSSFLSAARLRPAIPRMPGLQLWL